MLHLRDAARQPRGRTWVEIVVLSTELHPTRLPIHILVSSVPAFSIRTHASVLVHCFPDH